MKTSGPRKGMRVAGLWYFFKIGSSRILAMLMKMLSFTSNKLSWVNDLRFRKDSVVIASFTLSKYFRNFFTSGQSSNALSATFTFSTQLVEQNRIGVGVQPEEM